jgi:hypothetical protein
MKSFNGKLKDLPGWTGFNTLLHRDQVLIKSTIVYLPVIEGATTEMDTIMEILRQAVLLAVKLELQEIACVFDLAIYAKVQEIRWRNPAITINDLHHDIHAKTVIRLGDFHQSMESSAKGFGMPVCCTFWWSQVWSLKDPLTLC